jgi:hypothetical protein
MRRLCGNESIKRGIGAAADVSAFEADRKCFFSARRIKNGGGEPALILLSINEQR